MQSVAPVGMFGFLEKVDILVVTFPGRSSYRRGTPRSRWEQALQSTVGLALVGVDYSEELWQGA